ncbi:MAG: hypothetical protein ACOY3Y_11610 [Acidobacteriota bacterium]
MRTCEYAGAVFSVPRAHPWVDKAGSPECRYYDLTSSPELIRSSLEDFRPWRHYAAIEDFYLLLAALNQRDSALESNDCAFTGPHPNENPEYRKALQCTGRVMVLFRELRRNTVRDHVERLAYQLHCHLANVDPDFPWGVIGTTTTPVRYLALPETDGQQLGSQLMISFWAWGDTEEETMSNMQRVIENLSHSLRHVSAHL